ncbi:sulfotransferase [Alkalihalobacterium elongatum]|uniref:sulfotransferase n=1 Tax=Alkalihalobacterium elongatum TaxID=2675466 RepID=UPI001C1F53A5|nr:sulfotransferase [Alkalihalobacterium elongatum]
MDLIISSATHRSGSTMLQRIFNSRKQTMIWGEHLGCLKEFCIIYNKVKTFSINSRRERRNYFGSNENPNHWIARITPEQHLVKESIIESAKVFLNTLYTSKDHDVIGFKEVRYGKEEITLLRECFPNCNIILLVRNPIDSWRSLSNTRWNESTIHEYITKWNNHVSFYLEFSKRDDKAFLIKYEDIVSRDKDTMDLIIKLGKLDMSIVNRVLNRKIGSSETAQLSPNITQLIKNSCSQNMIELGY